MTPSLSALALRRTRRARLARQALPLALGLLLGFAAAAHARQAVVKPTSGRWAAAVGNGFKGDSLFFTVSPDGKRLTDVTMKGYWRCRTGGIKRVDVSGPPGAYAIMGDSIEGVQKLPYVRWDIGAKFTAPTAATGWFRVMYGTDCDTYKLRWTGKPL